MPSTLDITFYIPCLNEAENIGKTLDAIFEAVKPFPYRCEIIAVDDGSTDETFAVLQERAKASPAVPIRLIQNEEPKGLGYNYFAASLQAAGEYYMLVNGDNAEPAETLKAILRARGKADMIIPHFGRNDRRNFVRRGVSWTFTTLVNLITFNRIRYYNGPVLHRTENVRLHWSETAGYGYQAELICKLLNEGKSYVHVEVKNSDRERGFSKAFHLGNFLSVANSLFHVFLRQIVRVFWFVMVYRKPKRKWVERTVKQ
ncbi:MAG: glycosyltransferase family 2 protein [Deltaproteobacteria bacterium]|nr:glycosyltransferase family 2 protein [Deltaproteobacteria bacterium]